MTTLRIPRPFLFAAALGLLAMIARPAVAGQLTYTITLTPDSGGCGSTCPPSSPALPVIGQSYVGFFTLADDSVLAVDGINIPATLTAFRLVLGGFVWDAFHPSDFSGFRGPIAGDPFCPGGAGTQTPVNQPGGSGAFCFPAPSPGFDVSGGQIVDLFGDVFGSADVPFVDFHGLCCAPPGHFSSNLGVASFTGEIVLAQVPGAPTLLLLSAGLILLGGLLRRHRDLNRTRPEL